MSYDLVRLQGYPSSHLISYSVHDPGWFSGSCGQFSDWFTSGCAAWFLGVIIAVLITLTHQHMSTATAIINGNTVEADLSTLATLLNMVSNTVTAPVTNTQEEIVNETETNNLEQFDDFVVSILKEYFSETTSCHIVAKLSSIANQSYSDFKDALGLYFDFVHTIEQRNIMKVIFASYKLKSRGYVSTSYRYVLISKIKYASACPHCGADAAAIRDRLVKEGYLTV